MNGQDKLGTDADPEPAEMVVAVRRRAFYGWPRCWPNARTLRLSGRCSGVTKPVAYLEPHASADGIAFWRGDLYVAEWGQYLSHRFGRRLVRVHLRPGRRAQRDVVRLGLRAPARAARRPPRRPARRRLGPRRRLPHHARLRVR